MLRQILESELKKDSRIRNLKITVELQGEQIILSGLVPTWHHKQLILHHVMQILKNENIFSLQCDRLEVI